MPEISVIVPVYNVEKYLYRCIESILNQTFKDFELILVDDGSPDNCPQMCDDWAEKDSRIAVIHQQNQGVSVARNNGLNASNGKYIAFVDSDDWLNPEYIKILYTNMIDNDCDVSVCSHVWVENNTIPKYSVTNTKKVFSNRDAIEFYGQNESPKFRTPWGKLVSAKIAKQHLFPINRKYGEDMAVVYKWYYSAEKIIDSTAELYFYNNNNSNISNQKIGIHTYGDIETRMEIIDFFINNSFFALAEKFTTELLHRVSHMYDEAKKMCEYEYIDLLTEDMYTISHTYCKITGKSIYSYEVDSLMFLYYENKPIKKTIYKVKYYLYHKIKKIKCGDN